MNIIHRHDIATSHKARFANPCSAAERGYIDDVIVPHETRPKLIAALETLRTKRVAIVVDQLAAPLLRRGTPKRKHGNIPL